MWHTWIHDSIVDQDHHLYHTYNWSGIIKFPWVNKTIIYIYIYDKFIVKPFI